MNAPSLRRGLRPLIGVLVLAALGAAPSVLAAPSAAAAQPDRVFGAWSLICGANADAPCSLAQVVATDAQGRNVAMGVSVHRAPDSGRLRLEFRLPPVADPKPGLGVALANGSEFRLPMSGCTPKFCSAAGWMDEPIRKALEASASGQVAFMMPAKKQALLPLDLRGFGAGLAALQEQGQKPQKPAKPN